MLEPKQKAFVKKQSKARAEVSVHIIKGCHDLANVAGIRGCAASDPRTNKWCPNTLPTYLRCLRSLRLLETSRFVKSSYSYGSHGRVT